jgi:hypothetical protein
MNLQKVSVECEESQSAVFRLDCKMVAFYRARFIRWFACGVSRRWLCCSESQICLNTVHRISTIIKDYQDTIREMPYAPKTPFQQHSLEFNGDVNKLQLTFLFSDHAIRLQFLKDIGFIRSDVQCNSCGRDMTSYTDHSHNSDHLQVRKLLSYFF